jgi:carbon-monoxide dehydrogenase medium subunit
VEEALELLARHGGDAKPLAGGQSLVPSMNFRLARPSALIDLNGIAELFYLRADGAGPLRIGAMARQRTVERSATVAERAPLLHEAMPFVAHVQIRNRGTVGGSLAHADPAAELPAVMLAADARMRLRRRDGERWISAAAFFTGLFATALEPHELLVEVEVPAPAARAGHAFLEIARRHGDYALVGVAVLVTLDTSDRCMTAKLAFTGVGDGPVLAHEAAQIVAGERLTPEVIAAAAHAASRRDIDPGSDIHASAAYRRRLAEVLAGRALALAGARGGLAGGGR